MNLDKIAPSILAAMPHRILRLAGSTRGSDGTALDPDVNVSLKVLAAGLGKDFTEAADLVEARAIIEREAAMAAGPHIPASTYDTTIDGIPIRIYSSAPLAPGTTDRPVIIYLHGGGWVLGSLESHDTTCRFLSSRTGAIVLAVDYPLAPEHPAPAALHAVNTVVDALLSGTVSLRTQSAASDNCFLRPRRWALSGDSAGGNLTAAVCIDRADKGASQPDLAMLFAPVTDLTNFDTPSYREFGEGFFLTRGQMEWYKERYIGGDEELARQCSPLHADSKKLSKLGPTYVACAGFDVLRDEGIAYAHRLKDAGVPCTLRIYDSLVHPFVNSFAVWKGAQVAMDEAAGALSLALETFPNHRAERSE